MARLLLVVVLQVLIVSQLTRGQIVYFTAEDYGTWNETRDNFVELAVRKVGYNTLPFGVIIELKDNEDFLTDSWSITFPANSSDPAEKIIRIPIKEDDLPEDDEVFQFRLRSAAKSPVQVGEPAVALVTIAANDDANGVVGFSEHDTVHCTEEAGVNATLVIPVVRSRGKFGNVAVKYVITRVSNFQQEANVEDDLFPERGEIVYSEGENSKNLVLFVTDDKIPEDDEVFEVRLSETSGGVVVNVSSYTVQIVVNGNDCPIRFARDSYRVDESSKLVSVKFTRGFDERNLRIGPDDSEVSVDYEVIPGTALSNVDYYGDRSTVRFNEGQHEKTVKIFILNDDVPELAENFTLRLLESSLGGDAVLSEPSSCVITIEMNDKANGILSIDMSRSTQIYSEQEGRTPAFVIEEDSSAWNDDISVVRHGGAFQAISVDWTLTANTTNDDADADHGLSPTSGRLIFEVNQTRASVNFSVTQNDIPSEAKAFVFRLLAETITNGAEVDSPAKAVVYLADSDDVYGVIGIQADKSFIHVDDSSSERNLNIQLARNGGSTGEVSVDFSAAYFLPGSDHPMPGTLTKSTGQLSFRNGEVTKKLILPIKEDAFLDVNATFFVALEKPKLVDRQPLITSKTPELSNANVTLIVHTHLANGEVGFLDPSDLLLDEPSQEEGPREVVVGLHREGLAGEATVTLSYASVGENSKDVLEAVDYIRGPAVVRLSPGQSMANVTVAILPDDDPELKEIFVIRLDSVKPINQKLKRLFTEKKIIIRESDSPGGVFEFSEDSVGPYVLHEDETDSVLVTVRRSGGDLAKRMVMIDIEPDGSAQFYGVPNVLFFHPGEREQTISLNPRDDLVPELDLNYTIVIRAHGDPASVLGERTAIRITVLANDYPHGLFVFDDDSGEMPTKQIIGESKGADSGVAFFKVHRSMGSYGSAAVSWKLLPGDTNDVAPTTGVLEFRDGETEAVITVQSLADDIPESLEEFTFYLFNATDGSVVSDDANASVVINPNDQAIHFKGSSDVTVHEGEVLTLTVHRDGSGADVTSVNYRTSVTSNTSENMLASLGEDFSDSAGELTFRKGVLDLLISVPVVDDEIPEDDEVFYVELFNASGDYVPYGNTRIRATISQNDNANGVFSLQPPFQLVLQEGAAQNISINRSRGTFGSGKVHWKILSGSDWTYEEALTAHHDIVAEQEFLKSEGQVTFEPGQRSANLLIEAISDSVPEYDEDFMLVLFNVSNSRARLSSSTEELFIKLRVETNDHPHGSIAVSPLSSEVSVAEDFPTGDGNDDVVSQTVSNNVTIMVDRKMGTDGVIKVLWELYPVEDSPVDRCKDLLLSGRLVGDAAYVKGRSHVDTFAVKFLSDSFVSIDAEEIQPAFPTSGFTVSMWIQPEIQKFSEGSSDESSDVLLPLLFKRENETVIYSTALQFLRSADQVILQVRFRSHEGNFLDSLKVKLDQDVDLLDDQWHHLVVQQDLHYITVYVDGEIRGQTSTFGDINDRNSNHAVTYVGKDSSSGSHGYAGSMQDMRVYADLLTPVQIRNLFRGKARRDITPTSGYLEFGAGVASQNFSLTTLDDVETEINETFRLVFLDATGGAHIDTNGSGLVTALKSDNANGLFGFKQRCEPEVVKENGSTTCYISRARGIDGEVTVSWRAGTGDLQSENDEDFVQSTGDVTFLAGETEKSFILTAVEDHVPEIDEVHNLTLTKTTPHDGVLSSANFSGASVDEESALTFVTIRGNDKPNGVLQFWDRPPPSSADRGKIPEENDIPVLYVREESERVFLTVVRAAGWFGPVTVEWRTRDSSAISQQEPRDFESAAGTISFDDGQGYASIDIRLFDDDDPEPEKYFFVELSAPTGGATLNNGSRIQVVIDPSDDAFGFFVFKQSSRHIHVLEPLANGVNVATLQIAREGGTLGESIVSWNITNDFGNDVFPHNGQTVFADKQKWTEIDIDIIGDDIPEFDENIKVVLTHASKGVVGTSAQATAVITIMANDDPRGVVVLDPTTVTTTEASGNATLRLKRLMGASGTIRVHYTTTDFGQFNSSIKGFAVADLDFRNVTDSVLMAENVTIVDIVIPVYNDVLPETDEVFLVKLIATELVSSGVKVPNSPRLGPDQDTLAEVIISENDSPHGVLELSATSVTVAEDESNSGRGGSFLNVTRKLGTFGDVTVNVNVIPGTARPQEDYNLIASQVTLLEGESTKPLNLLIVDDFTPEVEENFEVQLLPESIVGGATAGDDLTCRVVIDESDDPYGALDISVDTKFMDEPADDQTSPVTFAVNRRNGRRGVVACRWRAFVEPASTAAASGDGSTNPADDGGDVDAREGVLHFVTNDSVQKFSLRVLPDDLPEDNELLRVQLVEILPGYQGRIDQTRNEARVVIPANDRPYGDISLGNDSYLAFEINDGDSFSRLTVKRSAGLYGNVRVVFSTSEIDLVSEMLDEGQDLLKMYSPPFPVQSTITEPEQEAHSVDMGSSEKPRTTCAEACLREKVCVGFVYSDTYYDCKWFTEESLANRQNAFTVEDKTKPSKYMFYTKNLTKTSFVYSSQARSGLDFVPVTGASVVLRAGQRSANIDITILNDNEPELDEFFKVTLLSAEMLDVESSQTNLPRLLGPVSARVTIHENDHPYGLFVLRSAGPGGSNELSRIDVEERPQLSLELVVERQGGSVGGVTVDWSVAGGMALRNVDFTGDDATLKFGHGETSKIISLTVLEDDLPEPDEDIEIRLSNPTGGAVVSESLNQTRVVILANDRVGGVVGFRNDSRAVIGREGQMVTLHLERSRPAIGVCEVTWFAESVSGHSVESGLNFTKGLIRFESGQTNASFLLYLNPDTEPETREVYRIVLSRATSFDIAASGAAAINSASSESEISIEESDDPHGIFRVTPTSQRITAKESDGDLEIYVTRQFGSIGRVRVYYEVIPGTLSTLNPDIDVAKPGEDFIYDERSSYVVFEDGVTSAAIMMEVVDDDIPELNEIFHVNLTKCQLVVDGNDDAPLLPPQIDFANTYSQVVIDANDGTKGVVRFHFNSTKVEATEKEGETTSITLQLVRDRGTYGEVDIFVFPQNKQAFINEDFYCKQETVTFSDGQSVAEYVVDILDDDTPEGDEEFDIFLDNPSDGLVLGNMTKATIVIKSNDDAHGRLAFQNHVSITLDEPDSRNIANSRTELLISRNPRDGIFGRISVRYKIEQLSDGGDVIPGQVIDLAPAEGYVTIDDRKRLGVLEVAVVEDADPELEECFRVTLFDPSHGATLNETGTVTKICIRQNDAPFGDFRVHPKGSRNATRDMRVTEGSGNKILHFDIVRHHGTLGRVIIDVTTTSGTALPLKESFRYPPAITPFQTFGGKGGVSFHSFDHNGTSYLIYLTSVLTGLPSTTLDSDGTLSSLTSDVHSTLYKWEGIYVPIQTIETDSAVDSTSFVSNGRLYVFICNGGDAGRRETISRLYKLKPDGTLTAIQNVDTKGASSVSQFQIASVNYLVVTNSMDNNGVSTIDSSVFQFDYRSETLIEIQTLPTRGAAGSTVFHMEGYIYFAVANRYDSEGDDKSPVMSVSYRWDPSTTSFTDRTVIDVSRASDVQHFEAEGKHFIIATSSTAERGESYSTVPQILKIFQVLSNDVMGQIILRPHQTIDLPGARKMDISSVPMESMSSAGRIQSNFIRDGSVTLLCVASDNRSCCYFFDYSTEFFRPALQTFPTRQLMPHVVKEWNGYTVAVAVAAQPGRSTAEMSGFRDPYGFSLLSSSGIYAFTNVHHTNDTSLFVSGQLQPDYVPFPRNKTLVFEPGETVHSIEMTLLDDEIPEIDESFKITLGKSHDQRAVIDDSLSDLTVIITANDDAHGVIEFASDSLEKPVEETERDNKFSLNVARSKSVYGRVSVDWKAYGNIGDVTPISGQIVFADGQQMVGIQMTVLSDDIPEIEELVTVELSNPHLIGATSTSPIHLNGKKSSSTVRILANDSPHGVVSWSPSSLHTVVSEAEIISGASQLVTLDMVRRQGDLGDIEVFFKTTTATSFPSQSRALPGVDFVPRDSSLVMRENSTKAAISISIIPDDVPEDIESFYVVITGVKLIGESEYNTQPGIGFPGTEIAEVTINENDDARGFIQLNVTRNDEGAIDAYELPGINNTLKIPVMRIVGLFRAVGVEWLARPGTAKNSDFFPSSGLVQFESGQKHADIEIFITDDQYVEFLENFNVQLVAASGGAKLGGDLTVTVNILPNDSPSGMFGFSKLSQHVDESVSAEDPKGIVEFKVQRYQGDREDVIVTWELEESGRDDLSPASGKLVFPPDVRSRSIVMRTLPDQIVEGEEKFSVALKSVTGGAEISPVASIAEVVINANPGAAGVVSLVDCDGDMLASEPEDGNDGTALFTLQRGPNAFGPVAVEWQIVSSDKTTFTEVQGTVYFEDLQNVTNIAIRTIDDDVPEMALDYNLHLIAASGGATIQQSSSTCRFTVVASDSPHGTFEFSQPVYHVKESDRHLPDELSVGNSFLTTSSLGSTFASVSIMRKGGHEGEVAVSVETSPVSAVENVDYYPVKKRLTFFGGDSVKIVNIEIIDDHEPEGPRELLVNLTGVEFLSGMKQQSLPGDAQTHLTRDAPPRLGDVVSTVVRIAKSDGAEGMVGFVKSRIEVQESIGIVEVPLVRTDGNYGSISVTLVAFNQTALRNMDYLLPSSGLEIDFADGQTEANASVPIVDDQEQEPEESFSLQLIYPVGGVRISEHNVMQVVIKKSDYPNGIIRFVGNTDVILTNPSVTDGMVTVRFEVERAGGTKLPVAARWRVSRTAPFIKPTTNNTLMSEDIVPPFEGFFKFSDGEKGRREILIKVLPSRDLEEVEEKFIINIDQYSPAELSPDKGSATFTVLKKGHPNGIIRFDDPTEAVPMQAKKVDEPSSGFVQLTFPITRDDKTIGDVNVTWSITPAANRETGADADDFKEMSGHVLIYDGQSSTDVIVNVVADDVPEIEENFFLQLVSVDGGAELDESDIERSFSIRENDDPHGVFGVVDEDQLIYVDEEMHRILRINVTRQRGSFGRVAVGLEVFFDQPEDGASYLTTNTGTVEFQERAKWSTFEIRIKSFIFLAVGDAFTVRLISLEHTDGRSTNSKSRLSVLYRNATVTVPPEAGNPQIGFDAAVTQVIDVEQDLCELVVTRIGLYGSVLVRWSSGYSALRAPENVEQGRTLPQSGELFMANLQKSANISLKLIRSSGISNAFAVHVTQVTSRVGGGAKVLRNRDLVEIDPSGVVGFSENSLNYSVDYSVNECNLTVQRLYGNRYDVKVSYNVVQLTAQPGVDYVAPQNDDFILMRDGESEAPLRIRLISSSLPELSKQFMVKLTTIEQPLNIYSGLSPRLLLSRRVSHVTIPDSRDARGVFAFSQATIRTQENVGDRSDVLILMLKIKREGGSFGEVGVVLSTAGGGETWDRKLLSSADALTDLKLRIANNKLKRASAGLDYEIRDTNVTFQEGQAEAMVPVVVLDDSVPESAEAFFVYLHSPSGGARVSETRGNAKVIIEANDVPNGRIGFDKKNYVIEEDSQSRSVDLHITRTHAFGAVTLRWRAVKRLPDEIVASRGSDVAPTETTVTSSVDHHHGYDVQSQLEAAAGQLTCAPRELDCFITLRMRDDDVSEFSESFYVILYDVSQGAEVDDDRRIANVTILDSDAPYGMFQFALSSRFPVVTKGTKSVGLTIQRIGGDITHASVRYSTRQLRRVVTIAGTTLYPAVARVDFLEKSGSIDFHPGDREAYATVDLVAESSSVNPLPQLFQVILEWSSGNSQISRQYKAANVTIVNDVGSKKVWAIHEALQQKLDDSVVDGILNQLQTIADDSLDKKSLPIFRGCLDEVLKEGLRRKFQSSVLEKIYLLFCKLLDPYRKDAVRGYSEFAASFEKFAFCLVTGSDCVENEAATSMTSCSLASVQVLRGYPELVNGHIFSGQGSNFFQLPPDLLDVQKNGVDSETPRCFDVHFIEYSSQLWFEVNGDKKPMSNKVFSAGVFGRHATPLKTPVRYRVYTNDARISPQGAECVLWNEASSRWLSTSDDVCKVTDDSKNFVDCECHHMSLFAARGPTDNLAGYNEATYAACFITMVATLITVFTHHLCSRRSTFAAKLMMHMLFACSMTQLVFVVGALTSSRASQESCAVLGISLHYFWLSQFIWIFMQSINILQVLAFGNENTSRLYTVHFVIGWGFPAIVILLYVIIMYALGSKSLFESYGDVHENGDMCAIMNIYGALLGAAVPAAVCMLAPIIVGLHLYQKDTSWKNYDDLFRGRFNSTEVPLLFWSFFLIFSTWLWGTLHLAFGYMWLLVLFIVFNFCQGFYILISYGILHNQRLKPTKEVYEYGIHEPDSKKNVSPDGYAVTSMHGSRVPSVSGEVMNKSTQRLVPKIEATWEEKNQTVDPHFTDDDETSADEEADFNDLMFALQTGGADTLKTEQDEQHNMKSDEDEMKVTSTDENSDTDPVTKANSKANEATSPTFPIQDTHL